MGTRYRAGLCALVSILALTSMAGCSLGGETAAWEVEWTDDDYRGVLDFCVAASENPGRCPDVISGFRDAFGCSPEGVTRLIGSVASETDDDVVKATQDLLTQLRNQGECRPSSEADE